jgi:hypothetical protein
LSGGQGGTSCRILDVNFLYSRDLIQGQDVISARALAKRTVGSLVVRITDTSLDLTLIPSSHGLHIAVVNSKLSIAVGKLFNVVAGSVSRAIVGAGGSAATLSGVTLVTLA